MYSVSDLIQTAQDRTVVEIKATTTSVTDGAKGSSSRPPLKEETRKHGTSKEAISNKYAAIREQKPLRNDYDRTSAKVSSLEAGNSQSSNQKGGPSSGFASTWRSMKSGIQNFKANIEARKFLPLRQNHETEVIARVDSSESLDEIFQRLKRHSIDHNDEDITGSTR